MQWLSENKGLMTINIYATLSDVVFNGCHRIKHVMIVREYKTTAKG